MTSSCKEQPTQRASGRGPFGVGVGVRIPSGLGLWERYLEYVDVVQGLHDDRRLLEQCVLLGRFTHQLLDEGEQMLLRLRLRTRRGGIA